MALHLNRLAKQGFILKLYCLLFAVFIAAGWSGLPVCAENTITQNASGIANIPPSVDPVGKTDEISVVHYDNRNGLPTSEANAITQTSEGFIWIGCYAGLIRYDGNTFERISSSTGIANVRSLYVDSRDRLWIGTNDSGLFVMTNGEFTGWDKADGLRSASIRAISEDLNGTIYAGGAFGLAVVDTDLNLTEIQDERIAGQSVMSLRRGSGNLIYGITEKGDLFTLKEGSLNTYTRAEKSTLKGITCILPDQAHPGFLYFGTDGSNIYYGNPENGSGPMEVFDISPLAYPESFELIGGKLWITAKDGIGTLDEDGFHLLRDIPVSESVGHMMTDYEGNLWFTSTRQGVMKIVSNQFSDIFAQYNLHERVVNSTCIHGQQLFIGTDSGLLVVDLETGKNVNLLPISEIVTASGKNMHAEDLLKLLNGERIRSIMRDSRERLWISTYSKYGLLRYDDGEVITFTAKDGLFSDMVRTTIECEDGTILAANTDGVNIIRESRVIGGYDNKSKLGRAQLLTMAEGFRHELIFGTDGGGIAIITDDEIRHIGIDDGLGSEIILRIKPGKSDDVYWIVTSNSLAYMTPDYKVTTIRQFPYSNNYDLFENSRGDIWVLSSNGVYVTPVKDLLRDESIDPVYFGISSGLPYTPTANAYSELTADNDLYIASSSGVVKVNIEEPFQNLNELKIALPFIDAGGRFFYPDEDGILTIDSSENKLTFYPYVFSSSLNDPLVSYFLDGFDSEDSVTSRSRLKPVNYTNLPGGQYDFRISVKDPVGHTTRTESFRIVKEKNLSDGAAGSIIMNITALFFMSGILIHGVLLRRSGRFSQKLFLYLILINTIQASSETISYVLESIPMVYVKNFMIAANTIYYAAVIAFAFLMILYFDYEVWQDKGRLKKIRLIYGIPVLAIFVVLILNLKTGWLFSIGKENAFIPGPLAELVIIPVAFFFLAALIRVFRISIDLALVGILLIAARIFLDIYLVSISSAAFINSLYLLCMHIYAVNLKTMEAL